MVDLKLVNTEREDTERLLQIKAKCIECTVRFLGHNQPFQKHQFYFFRLALLFIKYSEAIKLSDGLSIDDFNIETDGITTNPIVDSILEDSRLNGMFFDPLIALAIVKHLDFRHKLTLVFSLGLTTFNTQREFNAFYGVHSRFIQRYTTKALAASIEIDMAWDANSDQELISEAKECLETALSGNESLLIKYIDGSLVSSEGTFYQLCTIIAERKYVDTSIFTNRQVEIWNYIVHTFSMKGAFPTYIEICEALSITDELFWDNLRSIGDKVDNNDQPYRKSRNGQYMPLEKDTLSGRVIQIHSDTPSKIKKAKFSEKERSIIDLLVSPISGSVYMTIAEVAVALGISKENVRRSLEQILHKIESDRSELYITKNGELLPETHLRVRLCQMVKDPSFINLFNVENKRFIELMTERIEGVFKYSNLDVEKIIWGNVANDNEVDSSSRVNRRLASLFERTKEVEAVDTKGNKIRGSRLELIKLKGSLRSSVINGLSTSDLDLYMWAVHEVDVNKYLSLQEISEKLGRGVDSVRMAITYLLRKLKGPQEA